MLLILITKGNLYKAYKYEHMIIPPSYWYSKETLTELNFDINMFQ